MFGTLYYDKWDLAGAILEAIVATPDMDEKLLADKLYEISAENFGKRVAEFYQDLITEKNFKKLTGQEEKRAARFAKSVVYLPKKIVALPVNGSARMIKASTKQIKKLRRKNQEE